MARYHPGSVVSFVQIHSHSICTSRALIASSQLARVRGHRGLSAVGDKKIQNGTRNLHSRRQVSSAATDTTIKVANFASESDTSNVSTMASLPWLTLCRSYIIALITSNSAMLKPTLAVLSFLANSKSVFLNPDQNPVLRALLKRTFYSHFCAGESPAEVQQTIGSLKAIGYKGVIMGHARETILSREEEAQLETAQDTPEQVQQGLKGIEEWRQNTLATLALTDAGEFIGLKFTGAGREAVKQLKQTAAMPVALRDALHDICRTAQERGIGLLFDAEQASLQQGIDNWTMEFMKIYNRGQRPTVYGTYQAYAKRTPGLLAQQLDEAQKHNIVLGVKLVRGAYLNVDLRNLFWDTIEQTHECYDNIVRCMIEQRYGGILQPVKGSSGTFPRVDFVMASHNIKSVRKARKLRDQQAQTGQPRIPMAYGQLMGMADHVSCELVHEAKCRTKSLNEVTEIPQAYKYLVWGTMGECMKYLLRRANENKDAVSRTIDARKALGKEVAHRLGLARS